MRIGPMEILIILVIIALIILPIVLIVSLTNRRPVNTQPINQPGSTHDANGGSHFCSRCGKEMVDGAAFCASCGAPVNGAVPCYNPTQRSRIAAGLLGIFLGGFGVHRFYLGYTGIGIAQIAVTIITFGFGAIWGFIEGILILTGSLNRDARGMPLRD